MIFDRLHLRGTDGRHWRLDFIEDRSEVHVTLLKLCNKELGPEGSNLWQVEQTFPDWNGMGRVISPEDHYQRIMKIWRLVEGTAELDEAAYAELESLIGICTVDI